MSRFLTPALLRLSKRQENAIARKLLGRRIAGSGSMPGNKGDVRTQRWLIEAKQTQGGRFNLTLKLWRKIEGEAISASKEPAMVIEMSGRSLVVIDYNTFVAMQSSS